MAKGIRRASPVHSGRLEFSEPARRERPGKAPVWVVKVTDHMIGESVDKEFSSARKATAWREEQTAAVAAAPAESFAPTGSHPGGAPTLAHIAESGSQLHSKHVRVNQRCGEQHTDANVTHAKFNLRAVREVLEEYGLDPSAEIAKVLSATVKREVAPGHFEDRHVVAGVDRAKVLTELMQYVHPKLKAVEMKVEDKRTLTDEELNARINGLLNGGGEKK